MFTTPSLLKSDLLGLLAVLNSISQIERSNSLIWVSQFASPLCFWEQSEPKAEYSFKFILKFLTTFLVVCAEEVGRSEADGEEVWASKTEGLEAIIKTQNKNPSFLRMAVDKLYINKESRV